MRRNTYNWRTNHVLLHSLLGMSYLTPLHYIPWQFCWAVFGLTTDNRMNPSTPMSDPKENYFLQCQCNIKQIRKDRSTLIQYQILQTNSVADSKENYRRVKGLSRLFQALTRWRRVKERRFLTFFFFRHFGGRVKETSAPKFLFFFRSSASLFSHSP